METDHQLSGSSEPNTPQDDMEAECLSNKEDFVAHTSHHDSRKKRGISFASKLYLKQ